MIKTLAKSIREYKKETILTPIFVTFEIILEVVIPLIMAELVDNGVYNGDMNAIAKIALELIICAILSLVCGILQGKFAAKASSGFAKNLREDLYFKVQDYSFSNIDKFSTSSLVTRLTTDVTNVQNAFQMIIRVAVRTPLMLIFSLIASVKISAKLSLIFLILIPLLGIGLYAITKKVHPTMQKVFKRYDDLNNVVEENVSGIRVVKSYVMEEHEKEKFGKVSNDIYKGFSKGEKLLALNNPLMQGSIYLCILVICWFGAKIIVGTGMTELTTGELMTLLTYTTQILSSLMMLSMVLVMITISKSSAERICEVLQEEPDIKNSKNAKKQEKMEALNLKM